jgi:predicted transcriptional regulator
MKDQTLVIRIDRELKAKLKEMAEKSDRKLSDFVYLELKKLVEKAK